MIVILFFPCILLFVLLIPANYNYTVPHHLIPFVAHVAIVVFGLFLCSLFSTRYLYYEYEHAVEWSLLFFVAGEQCFGKTI